MVSPAPKLLPLRLLAGPVLALVVYLAPWGGAVPDAARLVAAIGALMAVWWMTEAIPIPVTALMPIVLLPAFGIRPIAATTASYAHPLIYLFLGGFMLALAMERWGLHKRMALALLVRSGTRAEYVIGAFMLATAFLSMWISNTATCIMMLPIGLSIVDLLRRPGDEAPLRGNFGVALMLAIAFGANIGGVATLIGSPPNALLAAFLRDAGDMRVTFGSWILVGLPIATVMLGATWLILTRLLFPVAGLDVAGGADVLKGHQKLLGPMSRAEALVSVVFCVAAASWIFYPLLNELFPRPVLDETIIAIGVAIALFLIPVDVKSGTFLLDWTWAKKLPWDILLLFGGGLSLAAAIKDSGLSDAIGAGLAALADWPFWLVVLGVTLVVIFMTELTSNTATAAAFLPIVASMALVSGQDAIFLAIPVTIAASFAFMLPVATPPNAVVYGSGHLTVSQMARAGIVLNLLGAVIIAVLGRWVIALVFG